MSFFSLTFLLVFMPLSLLLYYCTPNRLKNLVLLIFSLAFYYLMEPSGLFLMILLTAADYLLAIIIRFGKKIKGTAKFCTVLSVLKTIGIVFWFYAQKQLNGLHIPIGLIVYTLSSTGYILDYYHGVAPFERHPIYFFLYNCFFGRLIVGPYTKYTSLRSQFVGKHLSISSISSGILLTIHGIAKKIILADNLLNAFYRIKGISYSDTTLLSSWLLLLYLLLGVYFTMAAYCDIARGIGQIFCLKLPRNLYYPLRAGSVRDFVSRFHSTYMEFLRRYLYRPLGGSRHGFTSDLFNTFLCMILYGAWFALSPNCVVWGISLAVLMLAEKYIYGKLFRRLPSFFSRFYTFFFILISFTLLATDHLSDVAPLLQRMFTFDMHFFLNDQIVYILQQEYWSLILGFLLSLGVIPRMTGYFKNRYPVISGFLSILTYLGLLFLSITFLV